MNLVIDMNLSPDWVVALASAGHDARHWSEIGTANATDREILVWARDNAHVVFTHDLDFGAILAATSANAPSVIQVRTQDRMALTYLSQRLGTASPSIGQNVQQMEKNLR